MFANSVIIAKLSASTFLLLIFSEWNQQHICGIVTSMQSRVLFAKLFPHVIFPATVSQLHNQHCFVWYRCGGNHKAPNCRFKDATCNSCGKKGHLPKMCRSVPATAESAKSRKQQHRDNLRTTVARTKDSKAR